MPSPANHLTSLPPTWAVHSVPIANIDTPPRAPTPLPPYTEQDPTQEHRARVAEGYADTLATYAEDTHPDSVKQLELLRPKTLAPTYWQATGNASPLPEHVDTDEAPPTYREATGTAHQGNDAVPFSPYLSVTALVQATKHVNRLNDLLEQAEQLGTLLLERELPNGGTQAGGTSIDAETVAALCQKIDRLRSSWANGAFAWSSRVSTRLTRAFDCAPTARALKENALKAEINSLWDTAKTEYQTQYLTDPLHADPSLAKVYLMVKGLRRAPI